MIERQETRQSGRRTPANDTGDGRAEAPMKPRRHAPEERLAALEAELAEAKDRLLRALAETENVRRRAQREREDAQKYAISRFRQGSAVGRPTICAARSTACPRRRSRTTAHAEPARRRRGDRARAAGAPSSATGSSASTRRASASTTISTRRSSRPSAPAQPAGTVVEVLQPGYVLHDRLLRPAMVGVAKGGSPPAENSAPDEES